MLRRAKIKARPVIKKSQGTTAKSKPQNPKPVEHDNASLQPDHNQLKVIKSVDSVSGLSASIPDEIPTTSVSKATEQAIHNPASSQPDHDQLKIIAIADDGAALPTSTLNEKSTPDVRTTVKVDLDHRGACEPQDTVMSSSPSMVFPDNLPITIPQRNGVSLIPEPADAPVHNIIQDASLERDSNLNIIKPAVETNMQESPLPTTITTTTVTTIDDVSAKNKVIEVEKSIMPGGRRRKIMACPTGGKKRRKTDVRSEGTKQNMNADTDNLPAADPKHSEVSIIVQPDLAVCNSIKDTAGETDSCLSVNMPAADVNLQKSPLSSCTTTIVTSVTTIDEASTENVEVIESKKPTMPGGRRRKIMACPTAGKKRRKTEGTKQNNNTDASISSTSSDNPPASASPDSKASKAIALPQNVESTDIVILDLERCEVPTVGSQEVATVNVAALTTINEVPQSQIDDSPIYGINSSNDKSAVTQHAPAALDNLICDSASETSSSLALCESRQVELAESNSALQFESQIETKISHPKKCVVKIKTKSLSNKYRTKALEKLNRLKQNQSDQNEWPELDQNYVSMSDLIFLNPPAKVGHKLGMNADQEETTETVIQPPAATTESSQTLQDTTNDKPLPVPQIRIAEDGSVVVDEESLVLDTQKPQDPTIHTVYESGRDSCINQRSFMRRSFAKGIRWSVEETNEFYRCLRVVGAEFSLMSAMFRGRSPDDLRRKFRREHKNNPVRVDQALMQQHLSKWTDDMFKAKEPNSSSILKPPSETPTQS